MVYVYHLCGGIRIEIHTGKPGYTTDVAATAGIDQHAVGIGSAIIGNGYTYRVVTSSTVSVRRVGCGGGSTSIAEVPADSGKGEVPV